MHSQLPLVFLGEDDLREIGLDPESINAEQFEFIAQELAYKLNRYLAKTGHWKKLLQESVADVREASSIT